jgi:histone H2A
MSDKPEKVKRQKHSCTSASTNCFKFDIYIYKVLKQVHPDTGMSGMALATMVNLVKVTVTKIMLAVNQIIMRGDTKTLSGRDVQSAIMLSLPGELAKHAISESTKASTKYEASKKEHTKGEKSESRAMRAGLTFNVTRIERLMMRESNVERKSGLAAIHMAAAAEYITAEILDLAGNATRDNHRVRVTPRHIKLAICNDVELYALFSDTVIGGGVIPRIHQYLIPHHDEEPKKRKVVEVKAKSTKSTKSPKPTKTPAKGKKKTGKK